MAINQTDYETCNDLYDGDIVYSVIMLCVRVPRGGEDSCQGDSAVPLSIGKHKSQGLDRCDDLRAGQISRHLRLRCASNVVGGYFTGRLSTEGGAVSKTA